MTVDRINLNSSGLPLSINGVSLSGVVSCLPSSRFDNSQMVDRFPLDDVHQVIKNTGVKTRYVACTSLKTSDLCYTAACELLNQLSWDASTVDGLILMTQTPNQLLPATACRLQNLLGLNTSSFAFDVNLGCSAYPYGLWLAGSLMSSGAKRILLLAGDTINRIVDPNDRSTAFLFGDAGTATALEKKGGDQWNFFLGTDGSGADFLQASSDQYLSMDGPEVFEFTVQRVPPLVSALDDAIGSSHDYYLFHQANKFMLEFLRRKCKIKRESFASNISDFGNTSSASIPLLLSSCLGSLEVKQDLRLSLIGFGVGLSWAASSIVLNSSTILRTVFR